jgi:hypothetical protein
MRGRIMTFMAGWAAEEEFLESSALGGDADDRRQIDLMLNDPLPSDADLRRHGRRLRPIHEDWLRRHRVAISRVAALLLERKTLQSEEIERALSGRRITGFRSTGRRTSVMISAIVLIGEAIGWPVAILTLWDSWARSWRLSEAPLPIWRSGFSISARRAPTPPGRC